MADNILKGYPVTLFDALFMPNSYQILHVFDDQTTLQNASLYFSGIFNVHKHEQLEDDPRIINLIDLNVLKVYFSEREPTESWGYPTQLDDLYYDVPTPINKYGKDVWVIIANPSLYYYQTQMRLVKEKNEVEETQSGSTYMIAGAWVASLLYMIL